MTGAAHSRARLKAVLEHRREMKTLENSEERCNCPGCVEDREARERLMNVPVEDISLWIEGKIKNPKRRRRRARGNRDGENDE